MRYLELYLMMFGSSASIFMELFGGPAKHQPLDQDGTIPIVHLHNFEHASISLSIFIYAIFAIILDKVKPHAEYPFLIYIGSIAFAQELLLFHLHSTDHMGIEGQYHWLLQLVIAVCLITTILGIHYRKSFINSFVRSVGIMFQGIWMNLLGIVLWIPTFTYKGCYLSYEEGHYIERCHDDKSLQRAKAIANLQFCWFLTGVVIFSIVLYLVLVKFYGKKVEYKTLPYKKEDDVESETKSFIDIGKAFEPADLESNSSSPEPSSLCIEATLDPKAVAGKIVICDRGISPRVQKEIAVGETAAKSIKHYALTSKNATATLAVLGTRLGAHPTTVVAAFCSRGPNFLNLEILKPDMVAPGASVKVEPGTLQFTNKNQNYLIRLPSQQNLVNQNYLI
ncbi:Protein of unknown function DUF716 [Dillenia turbinata]|uniref:Uncharacterized protein n=1 Tax=Dillenia turbinata TaxID=194707 RepID=A0AAN8VNH4_9MAGN